MKIDVVLLSYTKNDALYDMTKNCIESLIGSEEVFKFDIKLIETDKTGRRKYDYKEVTTIVPDEEFNYNKFLNIGLKYCENDWVLISNNDIEYIGGWLIEMYKQHEKDNDLLSMSPYCPIWPKHQDSFRYKTDVFYGYRSSYEITGWCLLINRKVIEKIDGFDENFPFWYQDDDYTKMIEKYDIKHALIRKSIVIHYGSRSYDLLSWRQRRKMTRGQKKKFQKKWS